MSYATTQTLKSIFVFLGVGGGLNLRIMDLRYMLLNVIYIVLVSKELKRVLSYNFETL